MTKDIRTMSHLLYPPLLDEVGLQSALTEYVTGFAERSGIQVSLDLPAAIERLDRDYELSLFRIVQECLTNIHRHSGSKTASIRIVRDDGDARSWRFGMKVGACQPSDCQKFSRQVRASGSGACENGFSNSPGRMSIESDGSGTRIHVVIPTTKTVSRERTGSDEPVQTAV